MKKVLILIITVLSVFMLIAVASAGGEHGEHWKRLNGDYAMIASGGCYHSTTGFSETSPGSGLYTPIENENTVIWSATVAATAFWTFEPDGTGTVWNGENYVIDFFPGDTVAPLFPPDAPPSVNRMNPFSFIFKYTVTRYGDITITPDSALFPVLEGTVSQDKKTITLVSLNKLGGSPKGPAVCSITRILTNIANLPEPSTP